MPLVEITEEQEKILAETEFACLVSDRNNKAYEIAALHSAKSIISTESLRSDLQIEIMARQATLFEINLNLNKLRKKLGIETPTLHTEL